jgi:hypothetical protein
VSTHEDGSLVVSAEASTEIHRAAILLGLPAGAEKPYTLVGPGGSTSLVERHGRPFLEIATDLPAGTSTFTLQPG